MRKIIFTPRDARTPTLCALRAGKQVAPNELPHLVGEIGDDDCRCYVNTFPEEPHEPRPFDSISLNPRGIRGNLPRGFARAFIPEAKNDPPPPGSRPESPDPPPPMRKRPDVSSKEEPRWVLGGGITLAELHQALGTLREDLRNTVYEPVELEPFKSPEYRSHRDALRDDLLLTLVEKGMGTAQALGDANGTADLAYLCTACGRQAPLIDGECPDCRH